jgi:hypothetical protein
MKTTGSSGRGKSILGAPDLSGPTDRFIGEVPSPRRPVGRDEAKSPGGVAAKRKRLFLMFGLGVWLVSRTWAFEFGGANDITAVSARASKDYVRTRQADGSYTPESYAFARGGLWQGAVSDATIDKLSFLDVAHTIALPLASQGYIPSKDPKATKLLIMVYWGTTRAPEHANESAEMQNLQIAQTGSAEDFTAAMAAVAAENRQREQDDLLNVKMLGYDSWWEQTEGDHRGTALEMGRRDLISEIEENRYFVVLMAYDFQELWKKRKNILLWETRFSIRQRHHQFDKDLPVVAQYASQFFGQDTNGVVRKAVPLGQVDIGEIKSLGEVPAK